MNNFKPTLQRVTTSFVVSVATFFCSIAQAVTVDVAVVYDDATRDYYEGSPSTAIIAMVDQTNTFLANSLVDIQLNLVAIKNISIGSDLASFKDNAEVKALREESGADFMTLLVNSYDYCGRGYLTINASTAFNIVRRGWMSRS